MRPSSGVVFDEGCDVRVFGGEDTDSAEDRHKWAPVPLSVLPTVGPRSFAFQPGLIGALSAYGPNLLHVHGLWTYPSVVALQWSRTRKPYLVSPHGMLNLGALEHSAWKKRFARLLYENAHLRGAWCLHALCVAEYQAIRAQGLRNPVAIIPNGVDLPDLEVGVPAPEWESRLPADAKVLLFLGRVHPIKGLFDLLRALARARQRRTPGVDEWKLVVAGWDQGGHEATLKRLARELDIQASVCFVGPQFEAQKVASLRRANAFVLPSLSEGLPMSVLEAWAYGVPVVMTPQCNLPEGFLTGAAIRVEPTVDSLHEGLAELFVMSVETRLEAGRRGRQLVTDRFAWGHVGAEMARLYRWSLGMEHPPDSLIVD